MWGKKLVARFSNDAAVGFLLTLLPMLIQKLMSLQTKASGVSAKYFKCWLWYSSETWWHLGWRLQASIPKCKHSNFKRPAPLLSPPALDEGTSNFVLCSLWWKTKENRFFLRKNTAIRPTAVPVAMHAKTSGFRYIKVITQYKGLYFQKWSSSFYSKGGHSEEFTNWGKTV